MKKENEWKEKQELELQKLKTHYYFFSLFLLFLLTLDFERIWNKKEEKKNNHSKQK